MLSDVSDPFVSIETADPESGRIDVRMERADKLNVLPKESVETLTTVFESIDTDDGSVVVVRGDGNHFCAGADLADFPMESDAEREALATTFIDLTTAIRGCPLPVIAAVQGRAMGAGFLLALAADLVVAASDATFSVSEVKLGIPVSGFTTSYLTDAVGGRVARDWLFTGRDVGTAEAEEVGFAARTVERGRMDIAVSNLVKTLRTNSTDAIARLKSRMAEPTRRETDQLRADEVEAMSQAFTTGDAEQRITDFLQ